MAEMGRVLLILGGLLALMGLALLIGSRVGFSGRLPGDIVYRKGNFTFYFPLVTSILLSLLLTAVLAFFRR